MKKIILVLLLASFTISYSQESKVYPKESEIKFGEENIYIYEPHEDLNLPEKIKVKLVYEPFNQTASVLIKKEDHYEFSLKIPDPSSAFIMIITDSKGNPLDTNSDKGHVVFLRNKNPKELEQSTLSQLNLYDSANFYLKTKITPEETLNSIEKLFKQNPDLKNTGTYRYYVNLKYQINQEEGKPFVISYAKKLIEKGDDQSLKNAYNSYAMLKMIDEMNAVEKMSLEKYPNGELAKNIFLQNFFKEKDKTEKYILDGMQTFVEQFKDSSAQTTGIFYSLLIYTYLKNKDTINLSKYEKIIQDKMNIANSYNNQAWQLSGQDLLTPGKDLDFAEKISKKSIDFAKYEMAKEDGRNLEDMLNTFSDTYALILYKRGKYDEAFKYQHAIAEQSGLGTGGIERYARYAEIAKGPEFAKLYLENQLISGVDSKVMINQLKGIYKKLNLPENEFEKIKKTSLILATKKTKKLLLEKYGSVEAIDFSLTNLKGETISLSDYKDKVVVLDFWATWCGPCRSSFPHMQELVYTYKNKDVEFFFINTWERKKPAEIQKNVTKFIKDNNYSFNVLFDFNDDVVKKYKVPGIPTKIVINKNGEIISINSSNENLKALIEENIK